MRSLVIALVILIVVLAVYWYRTKHGRRADHKETYFSCNLCDQQRLPAAGVAVLNPFVYPYAATRCINELYRYPLVHATEPDNVPPE